MTNPFGQLPDHPLLRNWPRDLCKLSAEQREAAIDALATLKLSQLRKRQAVIQSQMTRGHNENLDIMFRLTTAAVDKREFPI